MFTYDDVYSKVFELLKSVLGQQRGADLNFKNVDISGMNSVEFIKFIVLIETEYDFEFYDDDLKMGNFKDYPDLIQYVQRRANGED